MNKIFISILLLLLFKSIPKSDTISVRIIFQITTHMVMALAICTPTFSSSCFTTKSSIYTSFSSLFSHLKTPKFHLSTWFPPLGLGVFSPWSGLKHLGISITPFGMCALLSFEIEMMVVQIGKEDIRVRWFTHLCLGLEHMRL